MAIPDNTIRCDEWYHPGCVGLREMALELVDTFFCPRCVAGSSFWVEVYGVVLSQNIPVPKVAPDPSLLVTSYKAVCARPDCRKPARAPLSKYCSDDCGIKVVMARVDAWGGDIRHLREHPLISSATPIEGRLAKLKNGSDPKDLKAPFIEADNGDLKRQIAQIQKELDDISVQTEKRKRLRQSLDARILLLSRAAARSATLGDICGFDERMTLDEKLWDEWLNDGGWDMLQTNPEDGEQGPSYCHRKRKCEWHYG